MKIEMFAYERFSLRQLSKEFVILVLYLIRLRSTNSVAFYAFFQR